MITVRSCVIPGCKVRTELAAGDYACQDCQRVLLRKLGEIEAYCTIASPAPIHGESGPHAKGYESTPPVRLDVVAMFDPRTELNGFGEDDILDEVPNLWADLHGWAQVIREEHPDHVYGWVPYDHIEWISQQPWVDEFASDMARVHSALRNVCQDAPAKSVGECITTTDTGDCRGEVYPTQEHDCVRCSRCRRRYRGRDLVRLQLAQSAGAA